MIESLNNPKVKEWLKLYDKKYRDLNNCFLIESKHILEEALEANVVKEIIATDISYQKEGIPFYLVSKPVMAKLSKQNSSTDVIAVVKKLDNNEIISNVCILDDIQDPGNLGAIIRSAVAFNIKTIIMSPKTVDLYNEKVVRATEGLIFKLNFRKNNLEEEITNLKKLGYKVYGTNVRYGYNLREVKFNKLSAIIIGNEGKGMNMEVEEMCDELINIPISNCESLNASVASSIIFYEMDR